jgi:hypothetical protein
VCGPFVVIVVIAGDCWYDPHMVCGGRMVRQPFWWHAPGVTSMWRGGLWLELAAMFVQSVTMSVADACKGVIVIVVFESLVRCVVTGRMDRPSALVCERPP